jgi:hypothetical protein
VDADLGGLTVTYRREGSAGIGVLQVSARVPPFAGAALGYFNDDDLRAFAESLDVYPLPPRARPELTSGVGDQETVGLRVSQITSRRQLAVAVHLADIDLDQNSPTSGAVSGVRMILPTSYQALHDFAAELRSAVEAQGGIAHLLIDQLS